ncbi:DUF3159 domain-containing protein [Corynebacterium sp. 335C]
MGGVSGLVATTLPVVVLVPVNAAWGLVPAMIAAVAVAAAIFVWRLARRETLQPAVSGLFGVLIGAAIAFLVGDAKGFFLYGIWYSAAAAVLFTLSILVRRPAVGLIWEGLNGRSGWREDRRVVRAYDIATAAWAVVFAARFVVQNGFYRADDVAWLGVARILMGWPLTALVLLVTVLAVRAARGRDAEGSAGAGDDAPIDASADGPAQRPARPGDEGADA